MNNKNKIINKNKFLVLIVLSITILFSMFIVSATQSAVDLGTARNFSVLAGAGITNTGNTTIVGDVGTFPTLTETGFGSLTLIGTNHVGDVVTQEAKINLTSAYNDAAGRSPTLNYSSIFDLGDQRLTPGVYNNPSSFGITGNLTLDAQGNTSAVWIFQTGSTLITAGYSNIVLVNGAQAKNIFWQVASAVTFGTTSHFEGNILGQTGINMQTGATINGRMLAQTAVTLQMNTVNKPE